MNYTFAKKLADDEAAGFVGQSKAKCPSDKTCLIVVVYDQASGEVITGAQVQVSGLSQPKKGQPQQTNLARNTDKNGLAKFTPWEPGNYTVTVSPPQQLGYEVPDAVNQAVARGTCPVCLVPVKPLPKLKVKVVLRGDHSRVFEDAVVKVVSGPQAHAERLTKLGIADFGKTKSGKYVVQVTSLRQEDRAEFVAPKATVDESLNAGDDKTLIIEVEKINVVSPKIELEYKVVLLNRDLWIHQERSEVKIYADPTYIQLSLKQQTGTTHPFTEGGKVKFTPAKVEVYLDEECKKKVVGDPAVGLTVTSAQLSSLTGLKLYLRGKITGKFTVTFELNDPKSDFIRLEKNPVSEEMGVVELKMKVHQQDAEELEKIQIDPDIDDTATYHTKLNAKVLPAQKALTDEEKVKVGRLLHVQKDGNDRARLLVEKLEERQWPAGTDDYEIFVNRANTSGSVEIYDNEWEGTLVPFGTGIKVSALKAAEKELWVEGKTATTAWRHVKLHLTLDRAEGGLPKDPKHNADWARFTVVEITKVKVDYTEEVGKAKAWDSGEQRFYINFKADQEGRKITIGAQLSQKLKDVTVHFMLAPDKENGKTANWGVDLPATWTWKDIDAQLKHKDKVDRKDLLHFSEKTDADGYAKKELVLSRFGGDKFQAACYIDQDPHLAKYVNGHVDLEKKKPVFGEHSITVWRKFWYQEIRVTGLQVAGFDGAADTYTAVKAAMEAASVIEMPRATADGIRPRAIYPKHMVSYHINQADAYVNTYPNDMGDALVVGDDNESQFLSLSVPETDKPIMIPMINAHALWVPNGPTGDITMFDGAKIWEEAFPIALRADKELLDPPLRGRNLLIRGHWEAEDWDPAANGGSGDWVNHRRGALAAADVSLNPSRSSSADFEITCPAALVMTAKTRARVEGLTLNGADCFAGTTYPGKGIVNSWTPDDPVDFINTINHEIGHAFKQVTKDRPSGIPPHPHQYDEQGSHCNYTNNSCMMYESGGEPIHLDRYCPVCHPYVLIQDMSEIR